MYGDSQELKRSHSEGEGRRGSGTLVDSVLFGNTRLKTTAVCGCTRVTRLLLELA